MNSEQIQSAIARFRVHVEFCEYRSQGRDCPTCLECDTALDVYGRLQEADQDRLLRIFDQYAVECGNCGCALIARGGSLGEHHGLTAKDSGSEDEQLCGYCAGLELADASAKLRDLDIANDQLITDETVLRAELTEARRQSGAESMIRVNPRGLSDEAVKWCLKEDKCPFCGQGELDTGYECNSCGYDAMPLVERLLPEPAEPKGKE